MNVVLTPWALCCEYLTEPCGMDCPTPRFTWKLKSTLAGDLQRGWRIRVTDHDQVLCWDSGWQEGDAQQVTYAGTPLRTLTSYHWQLQVKDSQDRKSDIQKGVFTTGILHADEWQASWIGRQLESLAAMPVPQDTETRTLTCEHLMAPLQLRREFTSMPTVKRACVLCSAKGVYKLWLDGVRVGDEELAPGWTDYRYRIPYQCFDVSAQLRQGATHVLAAEVTDGWWSGFLAMDRRQHGRHYGREPEFLAQLVIDYQDGTRQVIVTDKQWREHPGEMVYADALMGEMHDRSFATPGWKGAAFDDHHWPNACVFGNDYSLLVAQSDEPVRITQQLPARSVTPKEGALIVDFGQNFAGKVRLTVRNAQRGQRIRIRHGEMLDADGRLYVENLRTAECTDIFYAGGEAVEQFEPQFTFHGFRYAEITGYPGMLQAEDIVGLALHNDLDFCGYFQCSDPLINQLQSNILWGLRSNFVSIPTDCPQRDERLGWLADAQVFCPTANYNTDAMAFYTRWLRDVRSTQGEEGAYTDVAPRLGSLFIRDAAPAWGDGGVIIPWFLYQHYGDRRLLEESFASMQAWVEHIARHNPDGLWLHRRGNDYGDWLQIEASTPKEVVATAYYANSVNIVARAAAVLGYVAEQQRYQGLFVNIRQAFNQAYVGTDGEIKGNTQTGYLLALEFDLLPAEYCSKAIERLAALIEARGHRLTSGFVGVSHLAPVLSRFGRSDLACALLHQQQFPSWLYSILNGATTIWERWDGYTHERGFQSHAMNSFNHYSLGSVGEWFYSGLGGIQQLPGSIAWRHIRLQPVFDSKLENAKIHFASPRGMIRSEWTCRTKRVTWKVELPPGPASQVRLPNAVVKQVQVNAKDPQSTIDAENYFTFVLPSGLHEITMEIA